MSWTFMQAAAEFQQMGARKIITEEDAKLLLLRAKMILLSLTVADQFELEMLYRTITRAK